MTKVNERKRKLTLAGVTFAFCITIMLTGTFAWQSISQYALNETMGEMSNPGGRLHDDFNGSNKDIYIENFTGQTDGMPIIARIRLYEYMEIGEDAGKNLADPNRKVTIKSGAGADINSPLTWDIYKPGDTHYGYWTWDLGGQTVYMPTFNKNKDSKDADINGTYEGTTTGNVIHFDDYKTYQVGDALTGTADYDADDDNDVDEGNVIQASETHTAKETIAGTVISMADWLKNPVLGDYWVYDTDGWAYWANPLMPDTSTGLLLSHIQLSQTMTEKWYYGIYVESQMVTADEIADATTAMKETTGFYCKHQADTVGSCQEEECPSSDAQTLLAQIVTATGYSGTSDNSSNNTGTETATSSLEVTDAALATVQAVEEETEELPEELLTESDELEEKTDTTEEETADSETTDKNTEGEDNADSEETEGEMSEVKTTGDSTTENDTAGDRTTSDTTTGDKTTGDETTGDGTTGNDTVGDTTETESLD